MNRLLSPFFHLTVVVGLLWSAVAPLAGQTVISGGGNHISGTTFYLGTHTGSPSGFTLVYDDAGADAVKFHSNRIASWLWENPDGGSGSYPSMRLDQSNNLILYNGTNEGVKLNPISKSLTLGGASGVILTANGTALSTNGAFTVAGGITNTNGSFTGGTTGLTFNAGGTNQNITLNSSGTGDLVFSTNGTERARIKAFGDLGIGTMSPAYKLDVSGDIGFFDANPVLVARDSDNSASTVGIIGYVSFRDSSGSEYGWLGDGSPGSNYISVFGGATHGVQIGAGGVSRMWFSPGGEVGIGSSSPQARLQLGSLSDGTGESTHRGELLFSKQNTSLAATGGIEWKIASNNYGAKIDAVSSSGANFVFGLRNNAATWTEVMRINPAGNLGIGASNPTARLEVSQVNSSGWSGNLKAARIMSPDTSYYLDLNTYIVGSGNVGYQFSPSGNTGLVITTPGFVGIGTTTPAFPLDILGNNNSVQLRLGRSNSAQGIFDIGADASGLTLYPGGYPASSAARFFINMAGNVGIGTTNPQAKLQVGSWNMFKDGTWAPPVVPSSTSAGERIIFYEGGGWKTAIGMDSQNGIWFQTHTPGGQVAYQWFTGAISVAPTEKMRIMENGNVGIGTTNPTHKLAVNGTIRAKEVIVDTGWADYVFEEDYRLASLTEVESHIKAKGHLPGIPSAAEVAEHGVSMGDMQAKLLAKVEELTLHLIRMEKENAALRERVQALETVSTNP